MPPTLFVGHGGGPFPLMGAPHHADLIRTWSPGSVVHRTVHDPAVTAIVVVSAHHESADGAVEVMTDAQPGLLFDYGGFPPETYCYVLPNPGAPALADRILDLLGNANLPTRAQSGRGHDHGTFVPLLGLGLATHRPTLPVISISLRGPASHRPDLVDDHLAMGRALQPLRAEGVLVIGSGNSLHGRATPAQALAFDDHLQTLAAEGPAAFSRWAEHPMAQVCHPRPEHFAPLFVCAGAAPRSTAQTIRHTFMGSASSHIVFHG